MIDEVESLRIISVPTFFDANIHFSWLLTALMCYLLLRLTPNPKIQIKTKMQMKIKIQIKLQNQIQMGTESDRSRKRGIHHRSSRILFPGRSIDCEELIQMVEEGVRFLLIDVRDSKEVETTGAIQGAKLIPLPELKTALLMDEGKRGGIQWYCNE